MSSPVKKVKRIELVIVPGKSLGPFRLGTSLWDTIQFLRERPLFFPKVELKYSEQDPLRNAVIISLPVNGINLWFDGSLQRLKSIECFDPTKVKLVYQNSDVSSSRTIPTFLLIYKSFGPTYPGEFNAQKSIYTLNYPGLSFIFPIPQKHHDIYKNSSDLPMEFPDGTTPIANSVYLFHSQSKNFESVTLPPLNKIITEINCGSSMKYGKVGRREVESVVAKISKGIKLYFPVSTQTESSKEKSTLEEIEILLNVTPLQDILADLGKPSRIFYKEEDKMKIHSVTDESSSLAKPNGKLESSIGLMNNNVDDERDVSVNNATDYFLNYFHLGLDILIDGTQHICKKIILHGNIPGHYDFQKYKRCPFKLVFPKSQVEKRQNNSKLLVDVECDPDEEKIPPNTVTAQMKITTMQYRIPWISSNIITTKTSDETQLEQQKPVILTRGSNEQNPFGSTYLTGYSEGIVMEVMKNSYVPTIILF
ncbi:unnamed protein product [Cunninghamella blakesleeana]